MHKWEGIVIGRGAGGVGLCGESRLPEDLIVVVGEGPRGYSCALATSRRSDRYLRPVFVVGVVVCAWVEGRYIRVGV